MKNKAIFKESQKFMPGGVNSPVRAFKDVDVDPLVIARGEGAYIYDEDNNKFIDFVLAWGPMILGHNNEDVVSEISETLKKGISFGAPTELELKLARHICTTVDNVDMIRMVNSGTEATMSAVKLARGYTGRDRIVKFAGCYHGHFESFLVSAGSGVMTEGIPGSAGVPEASIKNTVIGKFNDIESIEEIFKKLGEEIAAVIIEPVAGNMGVIPAKRDFLLRLRKLCDQYGSILIFDEVMSGFRVAYKGAQSIYDIAPDMVTFAKIMGGGLPSGAYGGKREIFERLSPLGPVYQAGTMSGNPVVMAAGYATLRELYNSPEIYEHLEKMGHILEEGISRISYEKGIPMVVNRCGSMMTSFFTNLESVDNYDDAGQSDRAMYAKFFKHMHENRINLAPSQFEAMFLSASHGKEEIERFLDVLRRF